MGSVFQWWIVVVINYPALVAKKMLEEFTVNFCYRRLKLLNVT